jgi:hypothetical protein
VIPLADSNGVMAVVWTTDKGDHASGLTKGDRTFDRDAGLTQVDPSGKSGKKIFDKGTAVDAGSDGIVAWGRWIDGESKVNGASGTGKGKNDGKGKLATLHYVTFAGEPSLPVVGNFGAFASTAPTVTAAGAVVATGALNAATGTVNIVFLNSLGGGQATYNLAVPVAGQTFTLSGVATQVSSFGFTGISAITSTGSGCAGGCVGTLGDGASVKGLVGGTGNSRVGVTYGFDSRIGNIAGAIVLKP